MQMYINHKKQYQKDQQTFKSFDKFYRKSLKDSLIDENEYKSLANIFTKYPCEPNQDFFVNMNVKKESKLFSNNRLKFNLEPGV